MLMYEYVFNYFIWIYISSIYITKLQNAWIVNLPPYRKINSLHLYFSQHVYILYVKYINYFFCQSS